MAAGRTLECLVHYVVGVHSLPIARISFRFLSRGRAQRIVLFLESPIIIFLVLLREFGETGASQDLVAVALEGGPRELALEVLVHPLGAE